MGLASLLGLLEVEDSSIYRQLAHEGGKVVILMQWPPLPPGDNPGTHWCWSRLS